LSFAQLGLDTSPFMAFAGSVDGYLPRRSAVLFFRCQRGAATCPGSILQHCLPLALRSGANGRVEGAVHNVIGGVGVGSRRTTEHGTHSRDGTCEAE